MGPVKTIRKQGSNVSGQFCHLFFAPLQCWHVCVWQTCAVHFLKRLVQWLFQMFKCHFYPLSCWFLRLYLDWLCRLSEKHWRLAGWIKDLTDNFVVEFDWFAATVNYAQPLWITLCVAIALQLVCDDCAAWSCASKQLLKRLDVLTEESTKFMWGLKTELLAVKKKLGQWRLWNNKLLKINFINFPNRVQIVGVQIVEVFR